MQQSFYEVDLVPRTKDTYDRHCKELEEAPTEQHKHDCRFGTASLVYFVSDNCAYHRKRMFYLYLTSIIGI